MRHLSLLHFVKISLKIVLIDHYRNINQGFGYLSELVNYPASRRRGVKPCKASCRKRTSRSKLKAARTASLELKIKN